MLKITNHAVSNAPANGNGYVIDSMVLIVGGFDFVLGFGWMDSHIRQRRIKIKPNQTDKERERALFRPTRMALVV
ncbi:hypothetical protein BDV26DRAFT_213055 [Aspergillus bertholletiae]|uniref:Uncharacterized protein n=1 Tax=Aspergillus bertholletiae TaxID=1226010 RepID=A0A5N7B743_9EURO|nr:hypothetical protein BDV26DRAFT_213055 [Aspergillus bertholletiae]